MLIGFVNTEATGVTGTPTGDVIQKGDGTGAIEDSLIGDDGTTVSVGASKVTIVAASGNTAIAGTLGVTGAATVTGAAALNGAAKVGGAASAVGFYGSVGVVKQAVVALTDNTSGTPNNTLEAIPDPADTPITADALRDDLVANTLPALRNDLADLAAKVNEIRTVLASLNLI